LGRERQDQDEDVWKFILTEHGEQSAVTVLVPLQQRLLATDLASGMCGH